MLFATDLDNTLIYSYKKYDQGVCVEEKDGKRLSYMTPAAFARLQQVAQQTPIHTVPLTTRSLAQYQRIRLLAQGDFACALTGNGATLLQDGVVDRIWQDETQELIRDSIGELEKALVFLQKDAAVTLAPRMVDEAFVYAKSSSIMHSLALLRAQLDQEQVFVDHNGEKLYVFPRILTKGNALRRLQLRRGHEYTVAAGDSLFDLSMLQIADLALIPQDSALAVPLAAHPNLAASTRPGEQFAEFILDTVRALA